MKLTTSFYKSNIVKHDFKQFGWITVLYSIAFFLVGPLIILLESKSEYTSTVTADIIELGYDPLMYLFIGVPLFTGMFLFRYLHNQKSAGVVHSLPYTRIELLNNHFISGILITCIPVIVNSLIIVLLHFLMDLGLDVSLYLIAKWTVFVLLLQVSLLSFSIVSALITGTSSAQIVLGFIVLWLPIGLYLLWHQFFLSLLYGYANLTRSTMLYKLSPLTYIYERGYIGNAFHNDTFFPFVFLGQIIIFYFLSHLIYKYVDIENSGEVIAFDFVKKVFKYGLTTCSSLWIGLIMLGLSKANEYDPIFYLGFIIGGFVGYIIAELVLHKSIWGIKRYKGFIGFVVISALIFALVGLDITGYETKVPRPDEIESVVISSNRSMRPTYSIDDATFESKDDIQKVTTLHESLVQNQEYISDHYLANSVHLFYKLKDNSTLTRYYRFSKEQSKEELKEVVNTELFIKSEHPLFRTNPTDVELIRFNWDYYDHEELIITNKAHIKELMNEFKSDALSETYEERYDHNLTYANVRFLSEQNDGYEVYANESFKRSNQAVAKWLLEHQYINDWRLTSSKVDSISVERLYEKYKGHHRSTDDPPEHESYSDKAVISKILDNASDDWLIRDDYYHLIVDLSDSSKTIRLNIRAQKLNEIINSANQ